MEQGNEVESDSKLKFERRIIYEINIGRIRQDRCCFHCDRNHDRGSCVTSGGQIELPFQKITKLGSDEFTVASGGVVRPAEPAEAVDQIYCIYYDDGEMTISQNEIEPEAGRMVVVKGFYERPSDCASEMTTVRLIGAVKPKSCEGWFFKCHSLTQIKNIENLYTSECTDMSSMFYGCISLTSIEIRHFDTSNVTNMSGMFVSCESLKSVDVSHFDTCKVTNMSEMFSECSSLKGVDVSHFDTSNVTNMAIMFDSCKSLENVDVSHFNTSNVTDMSYMFAWSNKLTSLNVSNFDTCKVTNMSFMFAGCSSLKNVDVSHFDTRNVTDITQMFSHCTKLINIDLSNFNISNVTNMNFMFTQCTSLQKKGVKVSQTTYDKLMTVSKLGISADKFAIVK